LSQFFVRDLSFDRQQRRANVISGPVSKNKAQQQKRNPNNNALQPLTSEIQCLKKTSPTF